MHAPNTFINKNTYYELITSHNLLPTNLDLLAGLMCDTETSRASLRLKKQFAINKANPQCEITPQDQ